MRSCVADRRTDGQTDGAGYIGPAGPKTFTNWEILKDKEILIQSGPLNFGQHFGRLEKI